MILDDSWAILGLPASPWPSLAGHQSLPQLLLRGQLDGHLEQFVEMLRQLVHVHGPLHAETDLAATAATAATAREAERLEVQRSAGSGGREETKTDDPWYATGPLWVKTLSAAHEHRLHVFGSQFHTKNPQSQGI